MDKTRGRFELRRQIDGLVYIFDRVEGANGVAGYKRADGDYWIVRHGRLGWIAGRCDAEEVFGRPWDVSPSEQEDHPPEGTWVSRKGPKSYVYDLIYV